MRATIKDANSSWSSVSSGEPHGSILAPVIFITYNGIVEGTT